MLSNIIYALVSRIFEIHKHFLSFLFYHIFLGLMDATETSFFHAEKQGTQGKEEEGETWLIVKILPFYT